MELEKIVKLSGNAASKAIAGAMALGMAIAGCATAKERLVGAKPGRTRTGEFACYCLYGKSPQRVEKAIYHAVDPTTLPGSNYEEKCWSYCQNR